MKIVSAICISLFMLFDQCVGQTTENITAIEFSKQSRGFLDKVVVSPDSVRGVVDDFRASEKTRTYAYSTDKQDWSRLLLIVKDLPLKDIDGLQSPTMERAHDGAIHSNLTITFKDGKSISHGFDNENPHPDLKPLLDAILDFKRAERKK